MEVGSPCYGKLKSGWLIHSVMGTAITHQDTLKNKIASCKDTYLKMCVQKPKEVLRAKIPSKPRGTVATEKHKSYSQASKNGHTVHAQRKPVKSVAGTSDVRSNDRKLSASREEGDAAVRNSGSVHVQSFQNGHRRSHSDSSSCFYTERVSQPRFSTTGAQQVALEGIALQLPTDATQVPLRPSNTHSPLAQRIDSCLTDFWSNPLSPALNSVPYVRLCQINLSKSQPTPCELTKSLRSVTHTHTPSALPRFSGLFSVDFSGRPLALKLPWTDYTLEELCLAHSECKHLLQQDFIRKNLRECVKLLKCSRNEHRNLMGRFLEEARALPENICQLEVLQMTFEQAMLPEMCALHSANCVIAFVVDSKNLNDVSSTLAAIRSCLNNVRLYCNSARALIVLSGACDFELESSAAELLHENLEDLQLAAEMYDDRRVSVVTNSRTCFPLFNASQHDAELSEELWKNLLAVSDRRFPLVALRLNQMLQARHSSTVTQTDATNMLLSLGFDRFQVCVTVEAFSFNIKEIPSFDVSVRR